ncbi:hypothetical protein DN069_35655 [Streptacidiphilus pinicola]|uniref:Uncharacterized protein n=1 Tax=Streptacidiphilus pinicola TaxID=2219663 RepID=A0A2X0K0N5_9ACTN|nr:hypothetical protein [Streptacidiphilus pinicola]RAG80910.1 hypothetical protein DN069_35655 [Streptacidiphilus pinicola]
MSEEIKRQLRESAQAYRPDRARMLARAERGLDGPAVRHRTRPFKRSGPRTVLAGLATAGLLATGGFAVADIVRGPSPTTTVTTPTDSPSTTARPTPSPSDSSPGSPSATTGGGSRPAQPTGPRPEAGPLWSVGSVDAHSTVYWSQSDLVLRTTQPLTTLTLELRIAQTGGVQSTGSWRTLPVDDFTVTVREVGGTLVYRWVLKPGLTVPAGQYEFAAQFNHATGVRDTAGDRYRVDARTAAGPPVAVWGGFVPAG